MSDAARVGLDLLRTHYPTLLQEPPADWSDDLRQIIEVPVGTILFDEGRACMGFPLVIDGAVRVFRGAEQGRQIELYRVLPGDLCIVSATCLWGDAPLFARGVTMAPTRLLLLSAPAFVRWCEHEPFRRAVFGLFANRMADLVGLIASLTFQRLDQRLAAALLGRGSPIRLTHQQLADELGTVREMVTRNLRRFELSGWVQLSREQIEVIDPAALREFSSSP
jgi:CRP/FNR family transcriptional regulator